MTDRNVQFPNRFRLVPVPGTNGIYDIEPVPGEVFDEGTFLNKASLLTDETAELLGLPQADPTVNEAFQGVFSSLNAKIQAKDAPYASDFFLYITGRHPVLCAYAMNDYEKVRYEMMMFAHKEAFERTATSATIQLTGNSQQITVPITVYDGGNV